MDPSEPVGSRREVTGSIWFRRDALGPAVDPVNSSRSGRHVRVGADLRALLGVLDPG